MQLLIYGFHELTEAQHLPLQRATALGDRTVRTRRPLRPVPDLSARDAAARLAGVQQPDAASSGAHRPRVSRRRLAKTAADSEIAARLALRRRSQRSSACRPRYNPRRGEAADGHRSHLDSASSTFAGTQRQGVDHARQRRRSPGRRRCRRSASRWRLHDDRRRAHPHQGPPSVPRAAVASGRRSLAGRAAPLRAR